MRARSLSAVLLALPVATGGLAGCVERTITITSEPPGALAWLNDREIGRTPLTVRFVHYGTYDVRLIKRGFEPLLTSGAAKPPLWDNVGPDLVAEVLPWTIESRIEWHFVMEPTEADAAVLRTDVVERAREMREMAADDGPETPLVEPESAGPADS